jgi:hypothetical protein
MGSELQGHLLRLIDCDLSNCPSGFPVVECSQPLSVPTVLLPLVPFTMQTPFLALSRYKGERGAQPLFCRLRITGHAPMMMMLGSCVDSFAPNVAWSIHLTVPATPTHYDLVLYDVESNQNSATRMSLSPGVTTQRTAIPTRPHQTALRFAGFTSLTTRNARHSS